MPYQSFLDLLKVAGHQKSVTYIDRTGFDYDYSSIRNQMITYQWHVQQLMLLIRLPYYLPIYNYEQWKWEISGLLHRTSCWMTTVICIDVTVKNWCWVPRIWISILLNYIRSMSIFSFWINNFSIWCFVLNHGKFPFRPLLKAHSTEPLTEHPPTWTWIHSPYASVYIHN